MEIDKIYSAVRDFGNLLLMWIDEENGRLYDPFETIYGEGYGPGVAAYILAGLYRKYGEEKFLNGAVLSMNRVFEKLRNPTDNTRFTDIFLYLWSLKAYRLLDGSCPPGDRNRWKDLFESLSYDFPPPNTNGYCLLLSTSIMYKALGFKSVGAGDTGGLIDIIRRMQNRLGFIEDAMRLHKGPVEYYPGQLSRFLVFKDKMRYRRRPDDPGKKDLKPIAYHIFCCAVLAESLRWMKDCRLPELDPAFERIKEIVGRGVKWITHYAGSDGSCSMTERSRDQFWVAGCYIYLLSLSDISESHELIGRHLDWWSRYIKKDGSCSIMPNYFSNALRVGFEHYSMASMYNTLGFAFLLDTAEALSDIPPVIELRDAAVESHETFIDAEAGYAHLRRGGTSAGISLRRHQGGYFGGYCPAMGLFNVVIGGSRLRPLPAPSYRPRGLGIPNAVQRSDMLNHGVYEGIRAFRGGRNWGLDFASNAHVESLGDGVILKKTHNGIEIMKAIILNESSLSIVYDFKIKRSLDKLLVTCPLLLSDGKTETALKIRRREVTLGLGSAAYRLSCTEGYDWVHPQERYLLSSSGITSQLYVKIGENLRKGGTVKCSLLLERLT